MNIIGPGLITDVEKAALKADLISLVSDPDVSITATIKTPTGSAINAASGAVTLTTTDNTIACYASPLTSRELEESLYQEGDHRLLIDASLLSIAPTNATEATISGAIWRVVNVDLDSLSAVYHLVIRRST